MDTTELENAGLKAWIKTYLPGRLLGDSVELTPISGDAGFRAYYRINCAPPLVVAVAPPEHENNLGFVAIGAALAKANVHTPRIYAVDYQQGYLLQEDLGEQLYLELLTDQTVEALYDRAETALLKIQQTPADGQVFPVFTAQRLRDELALFAQWFVEQLLGYTLSSVERDMLDRLFNLLIACAQEQPQVVVHRDFHSRNLLMLADEDVGVIDFQDAVIGPCTYDLVSLLRDCYVCWPIALVQGRVAGFLDRAKAAGLVSKDIEAEQFLCWFDLMGLQRHLKVLGIFARLYLRDGKSAYLNDLPLVIRYSLEVAQKYPETREFYNWFRATFSDLLTRQRWYQDWRRAGEG